MHLIQHTMNELLKHMQVVAIDSKGMHELKNEKDVEEYLKRNDEDE